MGMICPPGARGSRDSVSVIVLWIRYTTSDIFQFVDCDHVFDKETQRSDIQNLRCNVQQSFVLNLSLGLPLSPFVLLAPLSLHSTYQCPGHRKASGSSLQPSVLTTAVLLVKTAAFGPEKGLSDMPRLLESPSFTQGTNMAYLLIVSRPSILTLVLIKVLPSLGPAHL